MTTKLVRRRRKSAYKSQSGFCCYCGLPMWEDDPKSFAESNGLTLAQAHRLKCTAEHLEPRKDGGGDARVNIAAACLHCNSNRHRRKQVPDPNAYRYYVQKQLSRGRWHCKTLLKMTALTRGGGVQSVSNPTSQ